MLKVLSAFLITLSLNITTQAMDNAPQTITQQVITELAKMSTNLPETGWSEVDVKGQMERLSYFELTNDEFKLWIEYQDEALKNWYQDTVNKNLEELYEEFIAYKGSQPAYQQFSDSLYAIKLDTQEKPILARKVNSSGNKNDCLLYSIIRDDKAVLTQILEDESQAQQILSIPEVVDRPFEEKEEQRNLTPVRQKILDDIKDSLETNKDSSNLIQALLQDPAGIQGYNDLNSYLTGYLAPQYEHMLPQEMALVISGLYGLNVQVFTPTATEPTESKVLHNSVLLTEEQTVLYPPREDIEPIYVYHRGVGGCHYQKLYILEK